MTEVSNHDMEILKTAHKALDDKFGEDITILDIRGLSVLTDYFIIATGGNINQVKAMADEVSNELHKIGVPQKSSEGYQSGNWILLDFGVLIVHIFDRENRSFYNLERVWCDAPMVEAKFS